MHPHTRLINAAIGFCKRDDSWIHPLADLGYKAELVEQKIGTEVSGISVTPDVVATSQRLIHSVVVECKGGKSVEDKQITNYKLLKPSDLHDRWVRIHDKNQHTLDVCLLIHQTHEQSWTSRVDLPILSLSGHVLTLHNQFSKQELNQKFIETISIEGYTQPVSYYPFSQNDDRRTIIPHALRAIRLSITKTHQTDATNPEFYVNDNTMSQIHKVWNLLSRKHQDQLKNKIKSIIKDLIKSHPKLKNFLENIKTNEKMTSTKSISLNTIVGIISNRTNFSCGV